MLYITLDNIYIWVIFDMFFNSFVGQYKFQEFRSVVLKHTFNRQRAIFAGWGVWLVFDDFLEALYVSSVESNIQRWRQILSIFYVQFGSVLYKNIYILFTAIRTTNTRKWHRTIFIYYVRVGASLQKEFKAFHRIFIPVPMHHPVKRCLTISILNIQIHLWLTQ